jgi:corrinoid protein of di/trimethylamine methyltransferase
MNHEVLDRLRAAIKAYDSPAAERWARKAVEQGVDPMAALDALTAAMREVGDAFGSGEIFLPELVGAADAMQKATPVLEAALRGQGKEKSNQGKVVVGTVQGDIHNIGKALVASLLTADGYDVLDLGVDVPSDKFVQAVRERRPDLLALSALLTVTAQEQRVVIEALRAAGLRDGLKVIVGGGAVTQPFAESIFADGYGESAVDAVRLAHDLVKR